MSNKTPRANAKKTASARRIRNFYWVVILLLVFIAGYLLANRASYDVVQTGPTKTGLVHKQSFTQEITIGEAIYKNTETVSSTDDRAKGLSGRGSINEDQAMLFVFDEPGRLGIWMKDMNFAIDILWLDCDGVISAIEENVSPETYPQTFYPDSPSQFVIELKAGQVQEKNIAINQKAEFKTSPDGAGWVGCNTEALAFY